MNVKSENLSDVIYTAQLQVLTIKFHSGQTYHFKAVPAIEYYRLMRAASKGQYFNEHIRGVYSHSVITERPLMGASK